VRVTNRHEFADPSTLTFELQLMVATYPIVDGGPPQTTQHVLQYTFPLEIDLLAELERLKLVERWDGWHQQPYTAISPRHVSVYGRL
jgi:hypothetical protein